MEIDKKLYNEIKAYCDLNGLKPREYIHSLLSKAFMQDKYGDKPGLQGVVLVKLPKEETKKADDLMNEIVESVGGNDKYQKLISDIIFDDYNPSIHAEENVAKNEETQAPEPPRDTVSQEVSRNEEKPKKRKLTAK